MTSRSPIGSAFRRCANIPASTATPTIGISRTWPRARSAAPARCSRKPRRSRRRGGSRPRISARGAKSISSRLSGSPGSSPRKARSPDSSSRTPAARARPIGPGLDSGAIPEALGGWRPLGPSAVAFAENYWTPTELSVARIGQLQQAFATAAASAYAAGFRVIEMHAAHGYLFHEFYSPVSNRRSDAYGGSVRNRTRMLRETVAAVREALPDSCPLLVRISSTDWTEGGWDAEQSVALARELETPRRRRDRLLLGRQCREGGDPGRCWLSSPLRRPHPAPGRNRDRRRRHDHRPRPGRSDRPQRRGRYRPARARNAA